MRAHVLASLVLAPLALASALSPAQSDTVLEAFRKGVELYQAGRYGEAEPLMKEALRRSEREFGPDNPGAAAVRTALANLYRQQGRYAEAEPLLRRALAIKARVRGEDHPRSPRVGPTSPSCTASRAARMKRSRSTNGPGDPSEGPRPRAPGDRHDPE
jgi:hypothetical protein